MPLEDRIEKYVDPNAPAVFDLTECRKIIRWATGNERRPGNENILKLGQQLGLALAQLEGVNARVETSQNAAMGYQKQAEIAEAEVRVMQKQVQPLREEIVALKAQVEALTPKPVVAPPVAETPAAPAKVGKKRGPKPKVVTMPDQTKVAQ